MLSNPLSKRHTQITSLSQKMADICEDSDLHTNSRQDETLKDKLKILHLASDDFQGGAESVFRNTIEITSKCDDFIIYTASCNKTIKDSKKHIILDDYQNYNKILGIIKYIFNIKNYFILSKALDELKVDIVHTQNYLSRLSPSVLFALRKYKKKNPKIKLIYTQHAFGPCANLCFYNYQKNEICESCIQSNQFKIAWKNCDRRGRIYSIIKAFRTLFYQGIFLKEQNLFDKIIFVSNFQMQKHLQDGYDKRKCQVITNPIDSKFYNANVRLEDKEDLIIFFGRVSEEKNIPLLIYAFRELLNEERFRKYRLLIIGNGSQKQECKNLAKKLFYDIPMQDTPYTFIEHLGPNELKNILEKSKISALPSLWYETFGLSIVESILSRVVPLVSEVGALKETKEQFGGLCFKLNDKENLYVVLKDTINNYEKYFDTLISWQKNTIEKIKDKNYLDSLITAYKLDSRGGVVMIVDSKILRYIYTSNHITFMDRLPAGVLKIILKKCNISVLPSFLYESFGLSIVESALAGVVPLVSDIGALKETKEQFGGKGFRVKDRHDLCKTFKDTLLDYSDSLNNILDKRTILIDNNQRYYNSLTKLYKGQ